MGFIINILLSVTKQGIDYIHVKTPGILGDTGKETIYQNEILDKFMKMKIITAYYYFF